MNLAKAARKTEIGDCCVKSWGRSWRKFQQEKLVKKPTSSKSEILIRQRWEELKTLKGVEKAEAIIEYRKKNLFISNKGGLTKVPAALERRSFESFSGKDCDAMSYWILAVLVCLASLYSKAVGGLSLIHHCRGVKRHVRHGKSRYRAMCKA